MKTLKETLIKKLVSEKLTITKDSNISDKLEYTYHPKTKEELKNLVKKLIKERGNEADLNDIDVSNVEDMSFMFYKTNKDFNGNISTWNVSNVKFMENMFANSKFNGDISNWDVSNVTNMEFMFFNSKFNGDISNWDVSNVTDMDFMFSNSIFNKDISKWNVNKAKDMSHMFDDCPLEKNPPKWYKN